MIAFALTIFTGAFLLFQVQPLVGKYILPWFGGGPGVWTTCMLFFQMLLLGGYAYAHTVSRYLKPRTQAVVHLVLLAAALVSLPITPSDAWKPTAGGNPAWQILALLTASLGLPYLVLSATGPLMQEWFRRTSPGASPYRLYALSNVGSLLALLSYPIYFEVKFSRQVQSQMWSAGLVAFVLFCGYCAYRVWKNAAATSAVGAFETDSAPPADAMASIPATDKLLWVALPMIASILLLATTNKLSQEVAVIPFLWVLPLSLYLLTFIICFDHARWYHRGVFVSLLVVGVAGVCTLIPAGTDAPMRLQIAGYTATLFFACMVCHGELYRLKPPPRQLTSYFLMIAAGGALGGFFVAIAAPAIFNDYRELQIGYWLLSYGLGVLCFRHRSRELALAAGIGALAITVALPGLRSLFSDSPGIGGEFATFFKERAWYIVGGAVVFALCVFNFRRREIEEQWQPRMAGFVMVLCVLLGAVFVMQWDERSTVKTITASRNFYGTLKVLDYYPNDPEDNYRLLLHGATTHGIQFTKPEKSVMPTTYYTDNSGVGRAMVALPETPRRIGLVGLGTGSLAVYARAGDSLRIYEINPAVEQLARTQFKYLEYCQGKVDVVMGDARLMMERELEAKNSQQFDLLALDAFSSDAIPVHLLTKEAFEIYWQHLKPDGVLAVHISNRYLNLRPVVEKLAKHFDLEAVSISDDNEPEWWIYATTWVLVTKNKAFLQTEKIRDAAEAPETAGKDAPMWTDDFASLYSILKQ